MADVEDLFGSDDDEPQQPVAPMRDVSASPEPEAAKPAKAKAKATAKAAPAASKPMDMKAKLAALAAAKRQEQVEAAAQKKSKKRKPAVDEFGDGDEEEGQAGAGPADDLFGDDEDEGGASAKRRRPRARPQQPGGEGEGEGRAAALPGIDEDDEANLVATDADRDFIVDDLGEMGVDFGDQELGQYEEAEEAGEGEDELEALFSKKKRRSEGGGMSDGEIKALVEALLAQMEVAAEEDLKAFDEGRPAVQKLKLLARVEDVLSTKRLHSELLDAGLLGVLKAWIEPMSDGTLPNAKVRETVLRLLHQLPVDCSLEDRKEQLKKSGLGRIVMFLFKVPDETPTNRRLAKELVERWSRPILAPSRARVIGDEEQERILAARQARQAQLAAQKAAQGGGQQEEEDEEGQRRKGPRPGEAGFRYHASIPQAAALDYVKAPASLAAMPEPSKGGSKSKADEHKLSKKLKAMAKSGRAGRAAVASVEGRNVTIQH